EWMKDERFAKTRAREAHWAELMDLIEHWTKTRCGQECEDVMLAGGVPCTRYRTVDEAMNDAQMKARGGMTRCATVSANTGCPTPHSRCRV
ncbi:MAG TPA: CoA transferase, partial [Burkholderiales bacterium]|nr:CoA transferase [Burkholderiales bacterium]